MEAVPLSVPVPLDEQQYPNKGFGDLGPSGNPPGL